MKVEKLEGQQRQETRALYEEVFSEDSCEFVDYYYQNKAVANEIFVAKDEETIFGMMHINPYLLCTDGEEEEGAYLVAVATKKEFRHRGIMTALLREAFSSLYEKREPFLYLMPASEAIYTPFDFRFFYWQNRYHIQTETLRQSVQEGQTEQEEKQNSRKLSVREAKKQDIPQLCAMENEVLSERYRLFAKRTPEYFADLMQELSAMKSKLFVIFDGEICAGSFQLLLEEEIMVLEPLAKRQYRAQLWETIKTFLWERKFYAGNRQIQIAAFDSEMLGFSQERENEKVQRKPWLMGRIIHLEQWILRLKSRQEKTVWMEVEDSWIRENEGRYKITVNREGGKIRRIDRMETGQENKFCKLSIAEIPEFFKEEDPAAQAFLNEWV
ncbi:MAG: GNAT family N-acetyltransferase [Lachnospiraceae bacterium]|nr:GNAT family N-acetyltransferase [Robinsoniella sp.]MDY3766392.1 GNAT family N-acetyltransferase [Lachnospiraceae bacterium]